MAQKPPKSSHKSPFLLVPKTFKLYNLRTIEAMKMKLGTIVYLHKTFHLTKDLGTSFRAWLGVAQKPSKKALKTHFLAQLLGIFISKWKPVTYVILCVVLHHWGKFFANRTWFGVVRYPKPPKSSHKSPFLLVPETFKLYNLRTTNAMKMKLGTIVYLYET